MKRKRTKELSVVYQSLAKRIALAALACVLAAATFVSAFTVTELHDHDCSGDDCPTCLLLDMSQAMLSAAAAPSVAQAVAAALPFAAFALAIRCLVDWAGQTPVSRGDRLLI